MLGDSYTFGYGVQSEETFSRVLEKSLNQKYPQKHFEVINAGLASGFTWDEAYLYVKKKGSAFQPDLIIQNVFLGNDIADLQNHYYEQTDNFGLPKKVKSKTLYVSDGSLRTKLSFKAKNPKSFLRGVFNKFICDNLAICRHIIRSFIDKNLNYILEEDLSTGIENGWEEGQKLLIGFKKFYEQNNISFMIVNIPIKEQVNDPESVVQKYKFNDQKLQNFANASDINFCELKNHFKQNPELAYLKYDSHLTAIGHQLAAERIEECSNEFGYLGR